MFDGIPEGNDDEQIVHVPCPGCLACNHITRDRPADQARDISICVLMGEHLNTVMEYFPIKCGECGKQINLMTHTTGVLFLGDVPKDRTLN